MTKYIEELKERVLAFNTLSLPGQPRSMHMGTLYLVSDLWSKVESLNTELENALRANEQSVEEF